MISRREWLRITASGLALGTASATRLLALAPAKEATVYKDASCGCCKKWVEHMEKSGWTVTAHDVPDVDVYKKKYGVPDESRVVSHRDRDGRLRGRGTRARGRDRQARRSAAGRRDRARRARDGAGITGHGNRSRPTSTTSSAFDKYGKDQGLREPIAHVR